MMQNQFTSEHQSRIVIASRHAEARHYELLTLARAGQPRRIPGAMLMTTLASVRERLLAATRREAMATPRTSCQPEPGMTC